MPKKSAAPAPERKEKKKRGPEGDFKGPRAALLHKYLPQYVSLSRKEDGSMKKGGASGMFPTLLAEYFELFPWRLPLDKDPDPDDPTDYSAPPASEDEEAEKAQIVQAMDHKLRTWFNRQRTANGLTGNPLEKMLHELIPSGANEKKKKRKKTLCQFYMSHPDFKQLVGDAFKAEHPKAPPAQVLRLRTEVARRLLAAEPESVRSRLQKELDGDGAEDEKEGDGDEADEGGEKGGDEGGENGGDGEEVSEFMSMSEADKTEARKRFATVAAPLIDRLRTYTGYEIVLLAGRVAGEKEGGKATVIDTVVTQAGQGYAVSPAQNFETWDPKKYESVMQSFGKFVWSVHQDKKKQEKAASAALKTGDSAPKSAPGRNAGTSAPKAGTSALPNGPGEGTPPASDGDIPAEDVLDGPEAATLELALTGVKGPVGAATMRELSKMEWQEQVNRLAELKRMSPAELEGAEQAARSRGILAGLGLSAQTEKLGWGMGQGLGSSKRKANVAAGAKRKTKKARREGDNGDGQNAEDDNEGGDDGSESSEEEEEVEEVEVEKTDKSKRPRPRALVGQKGKQGEGAGNAPEWAVNAREELTAVQLGDTWTAVVNAWWAAEAAQAFGAQTAHHSLQLRPREIHDWVARARRKGWKPATIGDGVDFGRRLRGWWVEINPEWRWVTGEDGELVQNGTLPLTRGNESLEAVDIRGKNGFLNVLMALHWWAGCAVDPAVQPKEWTETVEDVTWVLQSLTPGPGANESRGNPQTHAEQPHDNQPAGDVPRIEAADKDSELPTDKEPPTEPEQHADKEPPTEPEQHAEEPVPRIEAADNDEQHAEEPVPRIQAANDEPPTDPAGKPIDELHAEEPVVEQDAEEPVVEQHAESHPEAPPADPDAMDLEMPPASPDPGTIDLEMPPAKPDENDLDLMDLDWDSMEPEEAAALRAELDADPTAAMHDE